MDTPHRKPPLVFANRVIRMFVDQLVDDKMVILPDDYTAMRVTFRHKQGTWQALSAGDPQQVQLMADIVKAWGTMSGRVYESEFG